MLRQITAGVLSIAYEESGDATGTAVVLNHGFPYDVRAYDEVAALLAARGCRVIVPYLRGYGPTRFLSESTPRSGQQAALGHDLLALLDALGIERAVLSGYDWGGRAACVVAALWPERVLGLVSGLGYNINDIAGSHTPQAPDQEWRLWYQFYFHSVRGPAGLEKNRYDFCKLLWRQWSPTWRFDEATYARSAASFDNPDFVDVVIHSYRHRFALVPGDPGLEDAERRLATRPSITVPAIALFGADNGVSASLGGGRGAQSFTGRYERRDIPGVGHNLPQEAPREFADAVISLL